MVTSIVKYVDSLFLNDLVKPGRRRYCNDQFCSSSTIAISPFLSSLAKGEKNLLCTHARFPNKD